jgi:hypothetical protein
MSKKRNTKKKVRTSVEVAMSSPSVVLRAAATQTGGGSHGGSVRTKNRRDRRSTKQALRSGSY